MASKTSFTPSPDAERVAVEQGKQDEVTPRPDATADEPVTDPVAGQTPMDKPVTDAPAFAGPKNEDMPTPLEQSAPTESDDPILPEVEVEGPSPVLGAPIGVNPTVPQAAHVEAAAFNARLDEIGDPLAGVDHDGRIPMRHPDGGTSDAFERREDGAVLVPFDQIATMQEHGFVVVPESDGNAGDDDGDEHDEQEDDMRFKAPADTTGITLTSGPLQVEDGHVDAPDDLTPGDAAGLRANGFTAVPIAPADKVAELVDTHTKDELLAKAADAGADVKPSDTKPVIAAALVDAGAVPLVAGATEPTGSDPVAE